MDGPPADGPAVRAALVVLPCAELPPMLDFLGRLGFRLDRIAPADDPRAAELSGHGLSILLRRGAPGPPGTLRLRCADAAALGGGARELVAPNGTRIELAPAEPALVVPPARAELVVARAGTAGWVEGRAGMRYRDLIPGRLGGRFVASRIRIEAGGPVPDSVHFHAVRFQMIFCVRGRVRLVYEDQGPPFVLAAGDAVLQPPRIRHRVLECAPGLEVVELACPAEHDTFLDHDLELPTPRARPDRDFGGQRFARHRAAEATWGPWRAPGCERADLGFAAATAGLAEASVVRAAGEPGPPRVWRHAGELLFLHLLRGALVLEGPSPEPLRLADGDGVVLPAGAPCALVERTPDLELLEVRLPADA